MKRNKSRNLSTSRFEQVREKDLILKQSMKYFLNAREGSVDLSEVAESTVIHSLYRELSEWRTQVEFLGLKCLSYQVKRTRNAWYAYCMYTDPKRKTVAYEFFRYFELFEKTHEEAALEEDDVDDSKLD